MERTTLRHVTHFSYIVNCDLCTGKTFFSEIINLSGSVACAEKLLTATEKCCIKFPLRSTTNLAIFSNHRVPINNREVRHRERDTEIKSDSCRVPTGGLIAKEGYRKEDNGGGSSSPPHLLPRTFVTARDCTRALHRAAHTGERVRRRERRGGERKGGRKRDVRRPAALFYMADCISSSCAAACRGATRAPRVCIGTVQFSNGPARSSRIPQSGPRCDDPIVSPDLGRRN